MASYSRLFFSATTSCMVVSMGSALSVAVVSVVVVSAAIVVSAVVVVSVVVVVTLVESVTWAPRGRHNITSSTLTT